MSTEIVKQAGFLPAKSVTDYIEIGQQIAASGMIPGVDTPQKGFFVAITCTQQGISLFDYNRTYHTTPMGPSMRYDAMAAEFRKRGGKYKILSYTAEKAEVEFDFEGEKHIEIFTFEQAKKCGYAHKKDGSLKDTWAGIPEKMLFARAISGGIRKICPEIVAGIYTPEEVEDFQPIEKNVTLQEIEVEVEVKDIPIIQSHGKVIAPAPSIADLMQEEKDERNRLYDLSDLPLSKMEKTKETDYSICPIGPLKGKKWSEIDNVNLHHAMKVPDEKLPQKYKEKIMEVLKNA